MEIIILGALAFINAGIAVRMYGTIRDYVKPSLTEWESLIDADNKFVEPGARQKEVGTTERPRPLELGKKTG